MASNPKQPRKLRPAWKVMVEVGFIIFLFYSNLLMGEFTRANGRGKTRKGGIIPTKLSLGIALVIFLSLASCTKHPITRVTVKVAETYSGQIRLRPCIQGAQEPVALSALGIGNTEACPSGDVEIAVIKPSKTLNIAPENVRVHRKGDGNPTVITAEIP